MVKIIGGREKPKRPTRLRKPSLRTLIGQRRMNISSLQNMQKRTLSKTIQKSQTGDKRKTMKN